MQVHPRISSCGTGARARIGWFRFGRNQARRNGLSRTDEQGPEGIVDAHPGVQLHERACNSKTVPQAVAAHLS